MQPDAIREWRPSSGLVAQAGIRAANTRNSTNPPNMIICSMRVELNSRDIWSSLQWAALRIANNVLAMLRPRMWDSSHSSDFSWGKRPSYLALAWFRSRGISGNQMAGGSSKTRDSCKEARQAPSDKVASVATLTVLFGGYVSNT